MCETNDDKIECPICHKRFFLLNRHLKSHKISIEEFKKQYPTISLISDSYRKQVAEKTKNHWDNLTNDEKQNHIMKIKNGWDMKPESEKYEYSEKKKMEYLDMDEDKKMKRNQKLSKIAKSNVEIRIPKMIKTWKEKTPEELSSIYKYRGNQIKKHLNPKSLEIYQKHINRRAQLQTYNYGNHSLKCRSYFEYLVWIQFLKMNIHYEYEKCVSFKNYPNEYGVKYHKPDFYIPDLNLFIECKGKTVDTKNNCEIKKQLVKAQGYEYEILWFEKSFLDPESKKLEIKIQEILERYKNRNMFRRGCIFRT